MLSPCRRMPTMSSPLSAQAALTAIAALALATGCGHTNYVPGTSVPDSADNRAIVAAVEQYRTRLIEKNVEGLLLLASDRYFEDSGTPTAQDDYGYEGLKYVLANRLARLKALRYDIQYRNVDVDGNKAEVEVFLSGAFELIAESGDRYRRVSDYHLFTLERSGKEKWKFMSGM
jgi:hypothetical protein